MRLLHLIFSSYSSCRLFSISSRVKRKCFYEILKVDQNCSPKELKDAFIKLSKKHHPDRNNNTEASHRYFVELNEAYNVLSKSHSRKNYDECIKDGGRQYHHYYDDVYTTRGPPKWNASEDYEKRGYYGVAGVKRVPNAVIVLVCLFILISGGILQVLAIRHSFTFNREKLKQESARNQQLLDYARSRAASLTKDEQIQRFRELADVRETK